MSDSAVTSAMTSGLTRVPLLIGGEQLSTNEWLDVMDPAAPKQHVGHVALANEALARRAVDVAAAAAVSWGALEPERRAEVLVAALGALEGERAHNAELLVRENGKVRREA
jgi:acyl-CoA reductase-like NAD-dependent aldehyde dehydrogenase